MTDFEWTDDFTNTSSQAYMDLVEQLMEQVIELIDVITLCTIYAWTLSHKY